MPIEEIHRAPGVPPIELLGARTVAQWLGMSESRLRVAGVAREEPDATVFDLNPTPAWSERGGCTHVHLRLRRFAPGRLATRLRSRFTPPCSLSHAAREWNLLCHLRAAGVNLPEPLALGAVRPALFASHSFLLQTERPHTRLLIEWAAECADPLERRRAARALGRLLRTLVEAGVELPRLRLASFTIDPADPAPAPAEVLESPAGGRERRLRRETECGLRDLAGGRFRRRPALQAWIRTLQRLLEGGPGTLAFSVSELGRVFRAATQRDLSRTERRSLLKRLRPSAETWQRENPPIAAETEA